MTGSSGELIGERAIVLVGFMAAGKTTIGQRLADQLHMTFVDTDYTIEEAFGMPIVDLFAQKGEREFRTAECQIITEVLTGKSKVMSIGGGAYVNPATRHAINARAIAVWLDPPLEVILERLRKSTTRPLAALKSRNQLRQLWLERRESYRKAHIQIATSDAAPEKAVDEIIEALRAVLPPHSSSAH